MINITISRYCCVYWRTCIIIYWYNTAGWTVLNLWIIVGIRTCYVLYFFTFLSLNVYKDTWCHEWRVRQMGEEMSRDKQGEFACIALSNSNGYHLPGLIFRSSAFCSQSAFTCLVWISKQTVTFALYNSNWLVFVTGM